MNDEIFYDIPFFEGYQINKKGIVKRKEYIIKYKDGRDRTQKEFYPSIYIDSNGYKTCCINGKNVRIHWILTNTFIGDSTNKVIDHIDRNKLNNSLENLRIVENSINMLNRDLKYKPDITELNNGKKKYMLRFSQFGKRKTIGYYEDYNEALNKYNELFNERKTQYKKI